jgi:hypothetical protein
MRSRGRHSVSGRPDIGPCLRKLAGAEFGTYLRKSARADLRWLGRNVAKLELAA